jgi:hypothetical protein
MLVENGAKGNGATNGCRFQVSGGCSSDCGLLRGRFPRLNVFCSAATLLARMAKGKGIKLKDSTATANLGFEAKLWLTADTATRASAKPNPRSHSAGLLRSERQLLANPPFNDSDTALRASARHNGEAYLQVIRGAKDSWSKDDDVRCFSLSASNGERAGVMCRNPLPPPKGNANFAWVQHFIHHLAPGGAGTAGGMAGLNAVRQDLANGSMSSNQSGYRRSNPHSLLANELELSNGSAILTYS